MFGTTVWTASGAYFDSADRLLVQAHRELPFDVDSATFRAGVFAAGGGGAFRGLDGQLGGVKLKPLPASAS